jgi:hypothetical protein
LCIYTIVAGLGLVIGNVSPVACRFQEFGFELSGAPHPALWLRLRHGSDGSRPFRDDRGPCGGHLFQNLEIDALPHLCICGGHVSAQPQLDGDSVPQDEFLRPERHRKLKPEDGCQSPSELH